MRGGSKGLSVPPDIELVFLPPYSPGLNPVERLKRHALRNRLHHRLEDVMGSLQERLKSVAPAFLNPLCICNHL